MKHDNKPIIIVKKKKSGHGGHHGGSWKIAYADFMTAMMAFFLVMWLISISAPKDLVQIAEYFRTPLKVAITGGPRNSASSSPIPGGGDDPTQQKGEVHKQADNSVRNREERQLKKLQEDLEKLLQSDPRWRAIRPHLLITLTDEGLRIQIIDSQNRPMFRTGSAQVEPYMRDILRAIAPILDGVPNKISLAGHTDDTPYTTGERGYSNWELSADRANASRRELITGGLTDGKVLRVMGMSSTMRVKNHESDDAVNRRISILVLNKQAEQNIERENSESSAFEISSTEGLKTLFPDKSPSTPAVSGSGQGTSPAGKATLSDVTGKTVSPNAAGKTQSSDPAGKVTPSNPVGTTPSSDPAEKATPSSNPAGTAQPSNQVGGVPSSDPTEKTKQSTPGEVTAPATPAPQATPASPAAPVGSVNTPPLSRDSQQR